MIIGFKDKETEKVYHQSFSKRFSPFIQRLALRKLILLYIENPRIVRGFSKSFSVASSKSYSFRVRLDCGPSTAIKTLKEAI